MHKSHVHASVPARAHPLTHARMKRTWNRPVDTHQHTTAERSPLRRWQLHRSQVHRGRRPRWLLVNLQKGHIRGYDL